MSIRRAALVARVVACVLGLAAAADASSFRFRVENVTTGQGVVITDDALGDSALGLPGVLNFVGGVGNPSVNVVTGLSKPQVGNASLALLFLNDVSIVTSGPVNFRLSLEETGFLTGGGYTLLQDINAIVGGPAGSTAQFRAWANTLDAVIAYGPDTPVLGALSPLGSVPAGSVLLNSGLLTAGVLNSSLNRTFVGAGPFSLFLQADFALTGPGNVSFTQTVSAVPTPEPVSLVLVGAGLVGGIVRRRRRR